MDHPITDMLYWVWEDLGFSFYWREKGRLLAVSCDPLERGQGSFQGRQRTSCAVVCMCLRYSLVVEEVTRTLQRRKIRYETVRWWEKCSKV